jgi:hypothetical protein
MGNSDDHLTRTVWRQLFHYDGASARRGSVRFMDGTMKSAILMQHKQQCAFSEPLPYENISRRSDSSKKIK